MITSSRPFHLLGKVVAIDVGIEKLVTTSDGQYFPNLKPFERALTKVRELHRSLSRKRFLSHNWFKAKVKLARVYEHVKNLRKDIYMKLGKYFAEYYDIVVMEDISVKKLVGKSLKVRRRLHDVGFYEFRTILEYQLIKYGKKFQWCFTNFTQNDTISMEEKNIRAELEKSAYFNTRSKKFSYLLKKLTENEFIYKE
ncbi:Second ORF in transposon ISC1316 [Saccharolobus solfataricus P2]|uniref:Second ORF in transposon ISC1316 n=1 Tax=Saccharolobus solfataricus (strain ATCC 35092 / DSM 1617 / JCM 11322 / P2) TaxID=273057 RepID=Q97YK6_SACS2|nr:Second ORF in transposon ISC1316 [Saccharolobus solfataricus P2]